MLAVCGTKYCLLQDFSDQPGSCVWLLMTILEGIYILSLCTVNQLRESKMISQLPVQSCLQPVGLEHGQRAGICPRSYHVGVTTVCLSPRRNQPQVCILYIHGEHFFFFFFSFSPRKSNGVTYSCKKCLRDVINILHENLIKEKCKNSQEQLYFYQFYLFANSKLFRSVVLFCNCYFWWNNPYQRMTFTVENVFSVKNSDCKSSAIKLLLQFLHTLFVSVMSFQEDQTLILLGIYRYPYVQNGSMKTFP